MHSVSFHISFSCLSLLRYITWTARESIRQWSHVASSSHGTRMIANATSYGGLFSSSDAGATWTKRVEEHYWGAIALSSTGLKSSGSISKWNFILTCTCTPPGKSATACKIMAERAFLVITKMKSSSGTR